LTIEIKVKGTPAWILEDTTPSPFFGVKTIIVKFEDGVNRIINHFVLCIPEKNYSKEELIEVVKKEVEEKLGDFITSLNQKSN